MDKSSIAKTEALGPIIRGLSVKNPDYRDLCLRLLRYFEFEELSYVLAERKQDWKKIFAALKLNLASDPAWVRTQQVLEALTDQPSEIEQLALRAGLNKMTVSQTVNALDRGGYHVPYVHVGDREGRPRKAYYRELEGTR